MIWENATATSARPDYVNCTSHRKGSFLRVNLLSSCTREMASFRAAEDRDVCLLRRAEASLAEKPSRFGAFPPIDKETVDLDPETICFREVSSFRTAPSGRSRWKGIASLLSCPSRERAATVARRESV